MNGGFNTSGFTVMETLIVLGITALLLFSVLALVGGKTSQAQFTSAINGAQTGLQQVIDNASGGSYPNEGHFTCTINSGTIIIGGSTNQQGSNSGCTFIGSMVAFSGYSQPTVANQQYTVYTVVGQQCTTPAYNGDFTTCQAPTSASFSDTDPYLLAANTNTQSVQALQNGISLVSTRLTGTNGSSPITYSLPATAPRIAFLVNPAEEASAASPSVNLNPAALQLSLYSYTNSSSCNQASGLLLSRGCSLTSENEIDLCFASATTNQSGLIILGGGGLQSTISLKIFGGNNCNGT